MKKAHAAHTVKWPLATLIRVALLLLVPIHACAPLQPEPGSSPIASFVASNGSDGNAGSAAAPWATLQKAANAAKPGDTVTVAAGNYDERVSIGHSGTADAPILFQADGHVTMRGFTVEADYITIKGFEILNTPSTDKEGVGILVQGSYCDLEDNYIHDTSRHGISLFAPPSNYAQTSHCTVRNNRIERASLSGLDIRGNNHLVEGNDISATIQYAPGWVNPPDWVDADGIYFFGDGHVIRRNYIHDIPVGTAENKNPHVDCFQTWEDGSHVASSNTVIEQNRCSNIQSQARNTSDLGTGFQVNAARGLTIRNNLVSADAGLLLYSSTAVDVFNNDFIGSLSTNPDWFPMGAGLHNSSSVLLQNNIFLNQADTIIKVENSTVHGDHNLEYRTDGLSLRASNAYDNSGDLWGFDPLLQNAAENDFHLLPGSPAIAAGAPLTSVAVDYDGKSRGQGKPLDIGAYMFAGR